MRQNGMGKISKLIRGLAALVRRPYLLNKVLEDDGQWMSKLRDSGLPAEGLPVLEFTDVAGREPQELGVFTFLDGGSMITDLLLLKSLARRFSACRYFEIGTWRGESVVNVAEVAKTCDTLNLSAAEIRQLGLGEKYASLHGCLSKGVEGIRHWEGNSAFFDFTRLEGPFDLVFIDGDHRYEMVRKDTESVFRHLLHDGSIVVWHDYGFSPEKIRYEVYAGIVDGMPEEKRGQLYHISHTKCAVYLPGRWTSRPFTTPQKPAWKFRVSVSMTQDQGDTE